MSKPTHLSRIRRHERVRHEARDRGRQRGRREDHGIGCARTRGSRRGRRVLVVELDGKPALAGLVPDLEVRHDLGRRRARGVPATSTASGMIAKRLASTGRDRRGRHRRTRHRRPRRARQDQAARAVGRVGPDRGRRPGRRARGHVPHLGRRPARRRAQRTGARPGRRRAGAARRPDRCQVVLVTLPETTPVNELIETAEMLERRVGVRLGPVVVNQVDDGPPLPDPDSVSFGRARTHVDDAVAAARVPADRRRRPGRGARPAGSRDHARRGSCSAALPTAGARHPATSSRWRQRAAAMTRRVRRVPTSSSAAVRAASARRRSPPRSARRRRAPVGGWSSSRSTRPGGSPTRSVCPAGSPASRSGSSCPTASTASCGR